MSSINVLHSNIRVFFLILFSTLHIIPEYGIAFFCLPTLKNVLPYICTSIHTECFEILRWKVLSKCKLMSSKSCLNDFISNSEMVSNLVLNRYESFTWRTKWINCRRIVQHARNLLGYLNTAATQRIN